jgi:hypothetical protein
MYCFDDYENKSPLLEALLIAKCKPVLKKSHRVSKIYQNKIGKSILNRI